jgi:hypothetical protein
MEEKQVGKGPGNITPRRLEAGYMQLSPLTGQSNKPCQCSLYTLSVYTAIV